MTAGVLENLALLSGSPGGLGTLRQLIRDLGVSGRLCAGASKASWPEVRLSELVDGFQNGVSSRGAVNGLPTIVLRLADIKDGKVSLDEPRTLLLDAATIDKYQLSAGDVLVIRVNGSADLVGRFIVCESSVGLHCDHFIRLRLDAARIDAAYLKLIGDSSQTRSAIQGLFVSTAGQKTVNQTHIGSLSFPLPPLAEQHRIVAKVDDLMAPCDRLEARQQDAEAAHARLVQALLDSLTLARDAEEFQACWQLLAGQFESLFTTDASIEALEAAVLQLAVTGRLTAQAAPSAVPADEVPDLPPLAAGWVYRPFNELVDPERPVAYGVLVPGPEVDGGVPFVRIADLSIQSTARLPEKIIAPDVDAKFSRTRLVGGEILMGVVGSVGKLGVAPPSWAGANIARAICRIVPAPGVNKDYVLLLLRSGLMRRQFLGDTRTLAQPTLNVGLIRTAKAPVPPLVEQAQVVRTAHELLALCDQLKARVAAARAKHAQLAEALVAQAVAA